MKRGIIILALILIIIIGIMTTNFTKEDGDLEGELAESKQPQNLSIFVLPPTPLLTISSPENITYSSSSILLNYTVSNAHAVWYNLNNIENITIDNPLYFTVSEGSNSLFLYANNSEGITIRNINFSVHISSSPPSTNGNGGNGGNGGIYLPLANQTPACQESWTCLNSTQQRTCADTNQCNQTQLTENRICTPEPPEFPEKEQPSPWYILIILLIIIAVIIAIIKKEKIKKITNELIKKFRK